MSRIAAVLRLEEQTAWTNIDDEGANAVVYVGVIGAPDLSIVSTSPWKMRELAEQLIKGALLLDSRREAIGLSSGAGS
ncbi:MAG TPA: hypothetical protein VGH54_21460 [Mycobacterium sp.]|jgi:hypothetical protein|uniref:hypothetical protein n=1 Tax=Mycobacterium sp. TaxID=1785 RepID=UPI002F3E6AAD